MGRQPPQPRSNLRTPTERTGTGQGRARSDAAAAIREIMEKAARGTSISSTTRALLFPSHNYLFVIIAESDFPLTECFRSSNASFLYCSQFGNNEARKRAKQHGKSRKWRTKWLTILFGNNPMSS